MYLLRWDKQEQINLLYQIKIELKQSLIYWDEHRESGDSVEANFVTICTGVGFLAHKWTDMLVVGGAIDVGVILGGCGRYQIGSGCWPWHDVRRLAYEVGVAGIGSLAQIVLTASAGCLVDYPWFAELLLFIHQHFI